MAIHKTDDGAYVISSNHCWLPGAYDTERTARYAFRVSDSELIVLRDRVNRAPGHPLITFEMLQRLRSARKP